MIVGDLMQLRPPMANYVFGEPVNVNARTAHGMDPLFDKFQCMTLTTNHRHSGDTVYADLLEKVRFGNHGDAELELLKSRVIEDFTKLPQDAVMICGNNKGAEDYNTMKMNELEGEMHEVEAIKIPPPGNKSYHFDRI